VPSSVLICDPGFPLELVKETLPEAHVGPVGEGGPDIAALVCSPEAPVSAADIAALPGLRLIVTASVGTDHIAVEAAAERGIAIVNVPDYCVEEVSDHALAMILALRRGLVAGDRAVRAGRWEWTDVGEIGRVAGTRLGVVGLGRIGRALADKADALRMEVRHHDPYVPGSVDLDELLAWADAVSLHAPLTDATRGMIDARRLALMRPGAILVNTGRGATVDREALRAATHVQAAFDNVWERPPAADLVELDHLTMTPYVAWYSPQSIEQLYRTAARAVVAGLGPG
jgi:D-3-phosphoglycerate dehydrogenase / 2-oxoglutarate reductase